MLSSLSSLRDVLTPLPPCSISFLEVAERLDAMTGFFTRDEREQARVLVAARQAELEEERRARLEVYVREWKRKGLIIDEPVRPRPQWSVVRLERPA